MTTVSVVICTYNRAEGLAQTLAALRQQRHPEFEVVVVNGPSVDDTAAVLTGMGESIRVVDNPHANLSMSRNLGIEAAAGELVAFIDDDALPEPAWLEQIVPAFDDPEVAGAGGIVLDHTGMATQYRYSAASRFGEPRYSDIAPFDSWSVPGTAAFPYLQGTNAVFRRDLLAQVGLFDEVFDFYLDETDICCRLVDAGYVLRQLGDAPVHHKVLSSERRNSARVVTRWATIMRNHVYFGYRHALEFSDEAAIAQSAERFLASILRDARMHERNGDVEAGHVERARTECEAAIAEGVRLGRRLGSRPLPARDLVRSELRPYPRPAPGSRVRLAFVVQAMHDALRSALRSLVDRGHEIRVLTTCTGRAHVEFEGGVWVHHVLARDGDVEHTAHGELSRIRKWWTPDVVYADRPVEALGAFAVRDLATVLAAT